MEKCREDGARLLEVHKQSTRGNMRNSDAYKEKTKQNQTQQLLMVKVINH